MALVFDSLILAEGVAHDQQGAPTLVGVGRNVVIADDFPVNRHFAFYTHATATDDLEVGSKIQWRIEVLDPAGAAIGALTKSATVGEKKYEDLPGGVNVVAELDVSIPGPGSYTAKVVVESAGETFETQALFYAVQR